MSPEPHQKKSGISDALNFRNTFLQHVMKFKYWLCQCRIKINGYFFHWTTLFILPYYTDIVQTLSDLKYSAIILTTAIKSQWPSDATWYQSSESILDQLTAHNNCCMLLRYYLSHDLLILNRIIENIHHFIWCHDFAMDHDVCLKNILLKVCHFLRDKWA